MAIALEVRYRAFIPAPAISGPFFSDFGGDNRDFSRESGTSRGEIFARVVLTDGIGLESIRVLRRVWGKSFAYDKESTTAVRGRPTWWRGLRNNAVPNDEATLRATRANLDIVSPVPSHIALLAIAEQATAVNIRVAGALPLLPGSPDIDANIGVLFRRSTSGRIETRAVGRHDGFPAHECYVGSARLFAYNPVENGAGPSALPGFGDINVDTTYISLEETS